MSNSLIAMIRTCGIPCDEGGSKLPHSLSWSVARTRAQAIIRRGTSPLLYDGPSFGGLLWVARLGLSVLRVALNFAGKRLPPRGNGPCDKRITGQHQREPKETL